MTDNVLRTLGRAGQVAVGLLILVTLSGAVVNFEAGHPELGFYYLLLGAINLFSFWVITDAIRDL